MWIWFAREKWRTRDFSRPRYLQKLRKPYRISRRNDSVKSRYIFKAFSFSSCRPSLHVSYYVSRIVMSFITSISDVTFRIIREYVTGVFADIDTSEVKNANRLS